MVNSLNEISLIILGIIAILIAIILLTYRLSIKMALKRLRHITKSVLVLILSFSIISAVIVASLSLGDSVQNTMNNEIYSNIGKVDESIQSLGLYNESFYNSINEDNLSKDMIDATAPLIIMTASSQNNDVDSISAKTNLIGITQDFLKFGSFFDRSGSIYSNTENNSKIALNDSEIIINQALADTILAKVGTLVKLSYRNPELSIDTLFSLKAPLIQNNYYVREIVQNKDLGRFQLGASGINRNAFMNLETLQNTLGTQSKINTIIITNKENYKTGQVDSVISRIKNDLNSKVSIFDLGFEPELSDHVRLDNKNIFFSDKYLNISYQISNKLKSVAAVSPLCTYFVDFIGCKDKMFAYSTVSGFDYKQDSKFGLFSENITGNKIPGDLSDNEIILTDFTAAWINASINSTVYLKYKVIDEAYNVKNVTQYFKVKSIVDMEGKATDKGIPPYPGIKGLNCNQWNPPLFKMDFQNVITNESLFGHAGFNYWKTYVGAPKAYITLNKAKELWGNPLGYLTTIKIMPSQNYSLDEASTDFLNAFNSSLDYTSEGLIIRDVNSLGILSSQGVEVLTETFTAFGCVVIASSIIISSLFMNNLIENRKREIGIVKSLGLKIREVAASLIIEFFIIGVIGSIVGIIMGIIFADFSIFFVNTYIPNIVQNTVTLYFTLPSLMIAFAVSLLIIIVIISILSYFTSRIDINRALHTRDGYDYWTPIGKTRKVQKTLLLFFMIIISLALAYFFMTFFSISSTYDIYVFFVLGFIVILAASGMISINTDRVSKKPRKNNNPILNLGLQNLSRKKRTTFSMLCITALVVFTMLSLSIYNAEQYTNIDDIVNTQSGGYQIYGETSTAIMFDLNDTNARETHGINATIYPSETNCIQLLSFGSLGGTCSNLRNTLPPRLLGVNNTFFNDNKMKFYSTSNHDASDTEANWNDLNNNLSDGSIPVIGDYNTVLWILQKNIGDKVQIFDEHGKPRNLTIVDVLDNTVFQGAFFISDNNIKVLYPTKALYTIFLFKTSMSNSDDLRTIENNINKALIAYGMDTHSVIDMANSNIAIDSSYISLFQSLLIVGLVIGNVGIGVMALRQVRDRKYEIGVLRAIGFRSSTVSKLIIFEYLYIILLGILVGILSSFAISYLMYQTLIVPWFVLLSLVFIVIVSAFIAILWPAIKASKMNPADALRIEE